MNPASRSRSGGREPRNSAREVDTRNKVSTPDADMQAQDAGTGEGGESGRGRAADPGRTRHAAGRRAALAAAQARGQTAETARARARAANGRRKYCIGTATRHSYRNGDSKTR